MAPNITLIILEGTPIHFIPGRCIRCQQGSLKLLVVGFPPGTAIVSACFDKSDMTKCFLEHPNDHWMIILRSQSELFMKSWLEVVSCEKDEMSLWFYIVFECCVKASSWLRTHRHIWNSKVLRLLLLCLCSPALLPTLVIREVNQNLKAAREAINREH